MEEGNEIHENDAVLAAHRQATQTATEGLKVAIHEAHQRMKEELLVGVPSLTVAKRFTIEIYGAGLNTITVEDIVTK